MARLYTDSQCKLAIIERLKLGSVIQKEENLVILILLKFLSFSLTLKTNSVENFF